jgi:Protein of unknown function (DUF4239)
MNWRGVHCNTLRCYRIRRTISVTLYPLINHKEEVLNTINILNALPVWALALLVIGSCVSLSVAVQLFTRWCFGVNALVENHEVAGFKFAVVGVAYAVLLAFILIVVWNNFDRTQNAISAEAERVYNLHRTSYTFPEEIGTTIRQAVTAYAIDVRDTDWPAMQKGLRGSPSAAEAFTRLSLIVGQAKPDSVQLLPSVNHAFNLMQQIADFRLERLSAVDGQVTPVIWWVLALGAVINLGYPAFFATKHVTAQTLMTGGFAATIGGTLFLTIILNYPFSGPMKLTPEPIDEIIQQMRIENETGFGTP